MTLERPSDFSTQDWIIILESLAQWAGTPNRPDIPDRKRRAYELVDAIAAEQGLPPGELIRQIDDREYALD